MKHRSANQKQKRRGAILTMELVLVLPMFLLLLFAIVEFSMLMSARSRVADAAKAGVRRICIANASADIVRADVTELLGPTLSQNVAIDVQIPERAGEVANVQIVIPMSNAAPDLLWMTGFSVRDRHLVAEAPMIREHDTVSAGRDSSQQL